MHHPATENKNYVLKVCSESNILVFSWHTDIKPKQDMVVWTMHLDMEENALIFPLQIVRIHQWWMN
jgi:hypothetical protein